MDEEYIILSIVGGLLYEFRRVYFEFLGNVLQELGNVGSKQFIIKGLVELPLGELVDAWKNGLQQAMS